MLNERASITVVQIRGWRSLQKIGMILTEVKPTKNVNKKHQSFQKEVLPSRILIENAVYIWVTKYMGSLEFSKFALQKEEH